MGKLLEQIETHETWLDYWRDAWEAAEDRGSYETANRALHKAAEHAAIVNALRARAALATPEEKK